MKGTMWKTTLREIKQSLGRYLAILAIVALGVGLFSGLKITKPLMVETADQYLKEKNLYDFRFVSTYGFEKEDVEYLSSREEISSLQGAYTYDVLYQFGDDDNTMVMKVHTLTPGINELKVLFGRLPQKAGECIVDSNVYGKDAIGQKIYLTDMNEEDTLDSFAVKEFTITGVANASNYIQFERGNTSIGNGKITAFMYVLPESFDSDVYTEILVKFNEDYVLYSDEYEAFIDEKEALWEEYVNVSADQRFGRIKADAYDELADARKEFETEKADAEAELTDAKVKLDDAAKEIADGKAQIADGYIQLADGQKEIDNGKKQIADGYKEIEANEKTLNDGAKEIARNKSLMEEKEQELTAGIAAWQENKALVDNNRVQLETAAAELGAKEAQLLEGEAQLMDAEAEVTVGEAELAAGDEALNANEAELLAGEAQLDAQEAELLAGEEQLNMKETELLAGEEQLNAKEAELLAGEEQLNTRETELAVNAGQLEAKEESLMAKELELDELEAQLQSGLIPEEQRPQMEALLEAGRTELASGKQQLEAAKEELEVGKGQLEAARTELEAGKAQLATARAELEAGKQQIAVSRAELEAGKQQIAVVRAELEAGKEQVAAGRAELEAGKQELAAAREHIKANRAELEAGKIQLETGKRQISDGLTEIDTAESELNAAWGQLEAGQKQLQDGKTQLAEAEAELTAGRAQLAAGKKQLQQVKQELLSGERDLATARQDLLQAEAELADGEAEYADGLQEYEEGLAEFKSEIADAEAEIADAEQEIADLEEPDCYVLGRDTNVGYVCLDNDSNIVEDVSDVFPVFFFLIAALVCMTTMNRMIEEQRTQIGILKALGYSSSTIMGKYLFYSGSAAGIGCILGYFLGTFFLSKIIWMAYGMMYNVGSLTYFIDWPLAIVSFVCSMLCSMGVTWFSCRVELNEVAASLMRPKAPKAGKRVFLEHVPFIWKRLSFLVKVSIRNVLRYKKRFFMMIIGISGSMALLVTGFGIQDSIADVVTMQYEEIQKYDMSATFRNAPDTEHIEEMQEVVDGRITQYDMFMEGSLDLKYQGNTKSVSVIVPENPDTFGSYIDLHTLKGDAIGFPKVGQVVISHKLSDNYNISIGDTISLMDEEHNVFEAKVSGICQNFVSNYVFLHPDTCRQEWKAPEFKTVYFNVPEDIEDIHLLSADLMAMENMANVVVNEDVKVRFNNMMSTLDYLVAVIILCAAALAFIVLYNLTNINITERIREIATIKVLGFYKNETAAYVFRENVALTAIGSFVGLFLGKIFHAFVMSCINIDMIAFDVRINPPSYLYSMLLTFVFAWLVNKFMSGKLEKISMTESLKSVD